MFPAILHVVAQNWKQSIYSSTREQLKKDWLIHTHQNYYINMNNQENVTHFPRKRHSTEDEIIQC